MIVRPMGEMKEKIRRRRIFSDLLYYAFDVVLQKYFAKRWLPSQPSRKREGFVVNERANFLPTTNEDRDLLQDWKRNTEEY